MQDHSRRSWETLQGCTVLGPQQHAQKMYVLTESSPRPELIHLFCICHHVPTLGTLTGASSAPLTALLTIQPMSLQTSDAINSHLPSVRQEMVLYFQLIEQKMVRPPKGA